MEHPLRVEEYLPPHSPAAGGAARVESAATSSRPAAAVALPPLPNLPASDVLFLRPSDAQYAAYLPAANQRTQLSPAPRRAVSHMTQKLLGRSRSPVAPTKRGASLSGPTKRRRCDSSAGMTELGM